MKPTMSPHARLSEVKRALVAADDAKLLAVVAVIDRLADRGPLDASLAEVRPRLARLRPPRPLRPERVMCLPFEPLLLQPELWEPGRAGVPRSVVQDLIALGLSAIERAKMVELETFAAGRTMEDRDGVALLGQTVWPAAADRFHAVAQGEDWPRGVLRPSLRLAEMRPILLGLAPLLHEAKRLMRLDPRRVERNGAGLSVGELTELRTLLETMAESGEASLKQISALAVAAWFDSLAVLDLVRDVARETGFGDRGRLFDQAMRHGIAMLAFRLGNMRQLSGAGFERLADHALFAAAAVEAGQRRRAFLSAPVAESLKAASLALDQGLAAAFGEGLSLQCGTKLQVMAGRPSLRARDLEGFEGELRALRVVQTAGRRLGAGEPYDEAVRKAVGRLRWTMARAPAASGTDGPLCRNDVARMMEILAGPKEAARALEG